MTQFSADRPYNELPLLPPQAELETRAVLKLCIEARAALATLKQLGDSMPNQAVLINTLPMLEAQAVPKASAVLRTTTVPGASGVLAATALAQQEALTVPEAID